MILEPVLHYFSNLSSSSGKANYICNEIADFMKKSEIIIAKIIPIRSDGTVFDTESKGVAIRLFERAKIPSLISLPSLQSASTETFYSNNLINRRLVLGHIVMYLINI